MNRKNFLKQLGMGTALICTCGAMACRSKEEFTPINFQIDLSKTENKGLNLVGKSKMVNGVLVIHYQQDYYIAFIPACPHAGTNVKYDRANQKFICPNHGAEFDINGNVTKGPATTGIARLKTFLTGTVAGPRTLTIYS